MEKSQIARFSSIKVTCVSNSKTDYLIMPQQIQNTNTNNVILHQIKNNKTKAIFRFLAGNI